MNMETIFDFNPSQEEIKRYGAGIPREKYAIILSPDSLNASIAYMLHARGDKRCELYAQKLPNEMKAEYYRTINHP